MVNTYRGSVRAGDLGLTLIHEHLFVRNPELELNLPDAEWDESGAVELAVASLNALYQLGVRTVVDLTVPGLGRDVPLVTAVAERVSVNIVASTGWYTHNVLPTYFAFHGPGKLIDEPDPLVELFVRDICEGIAGTSIKAGMLKVMTDADGLTPDVARVMTAAAAAHRQTGVTITTHSNPASRNGLVQQAFLVERGVAPERLVIGHSGDSEELDYLRELMDNGSAIGMDRFGMEHVLSDERRIRTLLALLELGYSDRMLLSHDAAIYSHVTPPAWRAREAPNWQMENIPRRILPKLREVGVSDEEIEQMLVRNPARLLEPAANGRGTEDAS
ncbi:MAG TPA: phosphotriesterase-related protein [Candidatus Limnocylindria bacterium]|nr:phosphotriesterase-related protein [Candidatus Limnocylindria bacterium]